MVGPSHQTTVSCVTTVQAVPGPWPSFPRRRPSMRSSVATRTAAAVAATLMLAACGGAPTSPSSSGEGNAREDSEIAVAAAETFAKFNGMTGQERTDELVACAEEEGQLNVYTSNTDMEDLIDVFS